MSYCALPWLILGTVRLGSGRWSGAILGFWLAFNVLNGIQYPSVYALTIAPVFWLRTLRMQPTGRRGRFLAETVVALGVFLALSGWRLGPCLAVMRDYPRVMDSIYGEEVANIPLKLFFQRPADFAHLMPVRANFWETTHYVGPVVGALVLASLRQGWRWWHGLALLAFWLELGHWRSWQLSYWLNQAPVYAAMHVTTRWRVVALLGLALAAADVLARCRRSGAEVARTLAAASVVMIGADYLLLGHQILGASFDLPPSPSAIPGPPTAALINVEKGPALASILRGYGVIRGHEAVLGYDVDGPTTRLWRGHPSYRGEAWTADGPIEPVVWSPNRIVFRAAPGALIYINQNPGSWWHVNGVRAFPRLRCAEWTEPFTARADASGRLELLIRPVGLGLGLALEGIGVALAAMGFLVARMLGQGGPIGMARAR